MSARRGAAAVLAGGLLCGLLTGCDFAGLQDMSLPGGPDLGDRSYEVTAEFGNVLGLAEHSAVKLDGVTVGEVDEIRRAGWHAEVVLRLPGDVRLSPDATARVQQTSLLGEKFVSLDPGEESGQPLADGDRIALPSTSRGVEVEEVLGATSMLLNGGGLDQVRTISTELHAALDSGEVDTRRFLRELTAFITTVDDQRARIVSIMVNLDRLARQVNRDPEVVDRALRDLGPALRVLTAQRKPLVRMLDRLGRFSRVTTRVVRESGRNLVADLRALEPVLTQLRKSGDELPESVEAILSFPFPDEVLIASRGDYVNLAVEMDLTPFTLLRNSTGQDLGGQLGLRAVVPQDAPRPGGRR
jgi:phospholipid/cholesterol/gamma-HCH transport system substrate-binding protein